MRSKIEMVTDGYHAAVSAPRISLYIGPRPSADVVFGIWVKSMTRSFESTRTIGSYLTNKEASYGLAGHLTQFTGRRK